MTEETKTYIWNVRYYTLSDGHMSVYVTAKTGDEATAKAKDQDGTFDQLESIGVVKEVERDEAHS